jgi:hypothetical protein
MDISMPSTFPVEFREFGLATAPFFPKCLTDEDLNDPFKRRLHFDWSWQAVRYRYRLCAECNEEFKTLWKVDWDNQELTYKLERCIYMFFMSGLSVFDSFAFCLYFLGHAVQPGAFPDTANPRKIDRKATIKAFNNAFPQAKITGLLAGLRDDTGFSTIDALRNIVGHRLSGRPGIRSSATINADGTCTTDWHEETWDIPGAPGKLMFNEELLQRHLDDITRLLTALASAAHEFAENNQPAKAQP